MKKKQTILFTFFILFLIASCSNVKVPNREKMLQKTAQEILSNPDYLAICYGGYRTNSRRIQPTIQQIKEDLKIMSAMGIKIIRTYNVHLPHAVNILKAIDEIQKQDSDFEMYVMLGAWIDCRNAWTEFKPIHNEESERNITEIECAVNLANKYPHIVKVIAVGNEAMIKWATAYYVEPYIILKWVNYLQNLKKKDKLNKDLWITTSDNFASWGGGDPIYHTSELNELIHAVDYISMHTYPMHDTHYNPVFWGVLPEEEALSEEVQIKNAMQRAQNYAVTQYNSVKNYMLLQGVDKPIHIGETGWATYSNEIYSETDSKAVDEYKQALFYHNMRVWTAENNIACFYFEAFDEPWKDSSNPGGSENYFGLFDINGLAKYALWGSVDKGIFKGMTRDENIIDKTYNGDFDSLMNEVSLPPVRANVQFITP